VPFLDTTVLIDLMRTRDKGRHGAVVAALARLTTPVERPATSRFSVAEVLTGVARCDDPAGQLKKVEAVLAGMPIREFDDVAMRIYPTIAARQFRLGRPVGVMDMLIASVALASGQVLLTRNPKHFVDVEGLTVVSY
jgi:tRNA(fMet)-specific endonuclease VapC